MSEEMTTEQPTEAEINAAAQAAEDEQHRSDEDYMAEIKKLRQESAKYRTERNQLREAADKWTEYEQSQKTELERLQEANAAYEKQLQEATVKNTRFEVAQEYGIPQAQMMLLTGGNREDMEAQAIAIQELVKAASGRPPSHRPVEGLPPGVAKKAEPSVEYPEAWRPKNLR